MIAIVAAGLLNGCASQPDPVLARKKAYERLLSFIEPGMTRRQLYALLPPRRTPVAYPSRTLTVSSMQSADVFLHYTEEYELDREFSLFVQYRLADPAEYPSPRIKISNLEYPPGSNAIDELLFGSWAKPIKSVQNPDDVIASRPTLMHPRRQGATTGTTSDRRERTSTKWRNDR